MLFDVRDQLLDTLRVAFRHNDGAAKISLPRRSFSFKKMSSVSAVSFDLACAGLAETLGSTAMSFHFWHDDSSSSRE
jgi:hypothetical protein